MKTKKHTVEILVETIKFTIDADSEEEAIVEMIKTFEEIRTKYNLKFARAELDKCNGRSISDSLSSRWARRLQKEYVNKKIKFEED